jgi:hypothetical protein
MMPFRICVTTRKALRIRQEVPAKRRPPRCGPLLKRFASDSMSAFPIGQSCLIKTVNADQTKNLKITLADCTNLSLALTFIMEDPNYLGQAEAP